MIQNNQLQEDEIDLRELFLTIWKYKIFVVTCTFIITILSIFYVLIFKNPVPIYKGSVLIEIGEIKTENGLGLIDNSNNLKYIIEAESKAVEVNIPRGSSNLIEIIVKSTNKNKIESRIKRLYEILLKKQDEKLKMYTEYIPTKMIGSITVDDSPINKPKKKLIVTVAFVTGFILSILLVFLIEFIKGIRKEEKNK
ncbi:MAG: Wzz/FepE/Etk N-terminal domain-containing protein [Arcobacter sp.]|uniref:Wzz/FepE/Etk N-terminal domain-containing protein n=1 Tax=Arcobacter sp. TaxID=1872629 RepID=UPI003C728EB0